MTTSTAIRTDLSNAPDAPWMEDHSVVKNLLEYRRDKLRFILRTANTAPIARFRLGPQLLYTLREPEHIKHVLVDNAQNYDKQTRGYDALRLFLGHGLLTSEGEFWRRQRRIAQPAFHRERIAAFGQTMVSMTEDLLEEFHRCARAGDPVNIAAAMTRLTLRIAGKTLLGQDPQADAKEVGDAVDLLNHHVNRRLMTLVATPSWLPTPENRRMRAAVKTLDRIVNRIIAERRGSDREAHDLLSLLLRAEDADTGERMDDRQLRDEVVTMFLAGHETTANALAWTFYLLSLHPQVTRKLVAEIQEVLGPRPATSGDVPDLVYTQQVIKESMRLFPPAWGVDRNVIDDDVVGGVRLRKGAMVITAPWITHRQPHLWPNPMGFDPDRFTPEAEKRRARHAYFPFGAGARLCIGKPFAMLETVLIVATVLQHFRVELVPGHPVIPEALVTVRPRHGILVTVHPRGQRA